MSAFPEESQVLLSMKKLALEFGIKKKRSHQEDIKQSIEVAQQDLWI